ncbi:HAMP domain-containing histidine kinase [Fructobacillus sp. M1-13]|uniref:histidine kinase n=1 Tax=Fructobacillus papyriferae TaxID=2713171 RepID=A0ABS5QS16_9LACO|nr:HAMP domain-containing sensor histidine kinase [Fructobacillus papyriferae]MBS9335114.1 HAMP domain-containing histidine kinase [Fructobacillus papyriferae]MCD2159400.1 HAMP domain-containing histidine kinase [Fructobacillus papyriferae]
MVKKATIISRSLLKLIFGAGFILAAAWVLFFDLLKVRPSWSSWTGWPSFCLFAGLLFLMELLLVIQAARQKIRLANLLSDMTAKLPADIRERLPKKQKRATDKALRQLFELSFDQFLKEHQKQLREVASKEEMMTNISHDLRTPLTAIIGYLGLVVTPNTVMAKDDQQKYLETAYRKANQMKMLVEDLFEFAKLQSSQISLNINDFSLGDLFEQVLANYAVEAEKKGIQLTTQLAPELIVMAGDSEKLARVLINLLENALKYGNGASFIKFTGQERSDGKVEIRVVNNGPAIPKEAQKQLFDRFYRVESSRNTKTGGTGLGLSIVKGVIDKHHGKVRVESNDELTAFIITLPKKQEKEE